MQVTSVTDMSLSERYPATDMISPTPAPQSPIVQKRRAAPAQPLKAKKRLFRRTGHDRRRSSGGSRGLAAHCWSDEPKIFPRDRPRSGDSSCGDVFAHYLPGDVLSSAQGV